MTTTLAKHATFVANRLDTVLSTAAKNRLVFETFDFPDVKELTAFNKSCNKGLSDVISKLLP